MIAMTFIFIPLKEKSPFDLHVISYLVRRNNRDIKKISFVILPTGRQSTQCFQRCVSLCGSSVVRNDKESLPRAWLWVDADDKCLTARSESGSFTCLLTDPKPSALTHLPALVFV